MVILLVFLTLSDNNRTKMYRNKTVPLTYWLVFSLSCLFIAECGRVKRIIGGEEVPCGTQVRVASLRNSSDSHHLCGATVLSRNYAVTAAHCVEDAALSYYLQLNNYCLQSGQAPKGQILSVIKHYLYSPFSQDHDIAVLRIKLNFTDTKSFNDTILPVSSFGISGKCKIYGYGYRELKQRTVSETLHSADVKLISLDDCTTSLGVIAPSPIGGMMCALGENVEGDSGGPLMCAGLIQGLASYGLGCNVPGVPGVYVSVGAHLNWINFVMNESFGLPKKVN